MQEYIEFIETSLQQDFVRESILVVISVIFGGLITVIINNGAMKKQSRFDMQRKIIEGLLQQAGARLFAAQNRLGDSPSLQ